MKYPDTGGIVHPQLLFVRDSTRGALRAMFFQGFLIGLVAGVWLTVLYLIITTRRGAIRSYLRGLRLPPGEPTPEPKTAVVSSSRPDASLNASPDRLATPWNASRESAKELDLLHLSSQGAASYSELTRLVHDNETAQRLVQFEARRNPNTDVDELIDLAIDKLLRDRGYGGPHRTA